jgi:superfamily II DNA/RNA helicase
MNFADLGLSPLIIKALHAAAYQAPTAVQAEAIPAALAGTDLLVSAQTGSGKTAAFMLPSLHRVTTPSTASGNGPRILVLTPTRELAQQVQQASDKYGSEIHRLRTVSVVGGVPYGLQLKQMSRPVDIMVATPGRLMDHMERGRVDFDRLEVLILDEADRMLDMGFIDDIKHIVSKTPENRQTLLFSATLDGTVGVLARNLTRDPQRIEIGHAAATQSPQIEQRILMADNHFHKGKLLDALLQDAAVVQAIVFTATKASADTLTDQLREQGVAAAALHGDMPQSKRTRTLKAMHSGQIRVLVATDVAARGIDVPAISHVINFDLPRQAEDYVHRIGRTGRAGRTGIAISLAGFSERHMLRTIERYTHQQLTITTLPGLEPKPRAERPDSAPRNERSRPPYARQERSYERGSRFDFTRGQSDNESRPGGERRPSNRDAGFPSRDSQPRRFGPHSDAPKPYGPRPEARRSGPWEGRSAGGFADRNEGQGRNYWQNSPAESAGPDDHEAQPGANAWNSQPADKRSPARSYGGKPSGHGGARDGQPRGGQGPRKGKPSFSGKPGGQRPPRER